MSQENVEIVRRLNDAFKRRDLDAYLAAPATRMWSTLDSRLRRE